MASGGNARGHLNHAWGIGVSAQELNDLIALMRSNPKPEVLTPEVLRARLDKLADFLPKPDDMQSETVMAGRVSGDFITAPGIDPSRTLLYLHGGGYVIGSVDTHRILTHDLSRAADARVLSLEYSLAPEAPFPAGVDDAVAAYKWLLDGGTPANKIALAGDSAGGGLVIAALLAARDQGLPMPAAGVCFSPWIDMEGLGDSMTSRAEADPLITREGLLWYADLYVAGGDPRDPLINPLYADMVGLPPLYIQVGDAETLLDDAVRLDAHARAAGIEVQFEIWDDMIHVWQLFAPLLSEGRDAINKAGAFIAGKFA